MTAYAEPIEEIVAWVFLPHGNAKRGDERYIRWTANHDA
jgi:hypothetical protein